jgi:hypothetical protein
MLALISNSKAIKLSVIVVYTNCLKEGLEPTPELYLYFRVFMVLIFYIVVFWVLTPYSLIDKCQQFGQTCYLHCWSCETEFVFDTSGTVYCLN